MKKRKAEGTKKDTTEYALLFFLFQELLSEADNGDTKNGWSMENKKK